jgi:glycosyltransferase involved in cell wall biosynthesis
VTAEPRIAVSVIVPALNAAATIEPALTALARQDLERHYEVIVVDDGSTDGTSALARAAAAIGGRWLEVRVLEQPRLGPGPARNRGAQEARGEVLAFTDADCVPTAAWLREGLRALERADLVQGAVRPDPGARLGPFDHTVWVLRESGLYETANLFIRRALFERLGGFEDWLGEVIGKPLAEDVWLGWRARRSGAPAAFSSAAVVHHAVHPRGIDAYVAERLRLQYFPAIAALVPELRCSLFWGRWFLTRRSAAFDVALLAALVALVARSPAPLLAASPYAWLLARRAMRWRRAAAKVAGGDLLADAVGLAALAWGSVRFRSPLL